MKMATELEVREILNEFSSKAFYIQYHGTLANHMSHGIIALYRLGATTAQIQDFAKWYTKVTNLVPGKERGYKPIFYEVSNANILDTSKLQAYQGSSTNYYELIAHYNSVLGLKYNGCLDAFFRGEYPRLATSLHSALMHATIQIGYGLSVNSSATVAEGFAYQHMTHREPLLKPKSGSLNLVANSLSPIEVLSKLRTDTVLKERLHRKASPSNNICDLNRIDGHLNRDHLQLTLFEEEIRSRILEYVEALIYPKTSDSTAVDIPALPCWLIEIALTVYACAEHENDFFLLHGVTGAWALQQILERLDDNLVKIQCVKSFLAFLLGLYSSLGFPAIVLEKLESSKIKEKNISDYKTEVLLGNRDEHFYKLVHVCCDWLLQNPEDTAKETLCKLACDNALHIKGVFFVYE